jgi:type II secretory pathway pseudopilin PulG
MRRGAFMARVNINYTEKDYKVFHNYCTNYCGLYDETRKNSIKILLELYKHQIIDFQENSLDNVFAFFFQKKQFFETESCIPANDANEMMRIRTCSDIIAFLEDLEKIYVLLKRKGIKTNYLLIIGAFSKIIDEENQIRVRELQDAASGALNSIVSPLGDAIEKKFSPDIDTLILLKELLNFASTFNRFSSDIKFTDEIINLVAYSLAKRFNKKESYDELQVLLSECHNQFKVDELESALEGEFPSQNDWEMDFFWEELVQPLIEINEIIATSQKKQLVTLDVLAALESPLSAKPANSGYSQLSPYQYPYGMLRKRNDENQFIINVDNFSHDDVQLYTPSEYTTPEIYHADKNTMYFSLTWGVIAILAIILLSAVFSLSSLSVDAKTHQNNQVTRMAGQSGENPYSTIYSAAPSSGVYPSTYSNGMVQQSGQNSYPASSMANQSSEDAYMNINGIIQQPGDSPTSNVIGGIIYTNSHDSSINSYTRLSPPTMEINPPTVSPYVTIEPVALEPDTSPKSHREEIDTLRSVPDLLFDPMDYFTIFQRNFSSNTQNSYKVSYNLQNPPMIIHYTVVPQNITDVKWFEPHDMADLIDTAIVNRPDEFSQFEMKISENGALVDKAGWGGLYGNPLTTQQIIIRNPGLVQIEFSGNRVMVSIEILVKKEGNIG